MRHQARQTRFDNVSGIVTCFFGWCIIVYSLDSLISFIKDWVRCRDDS